MRPRALALFIALTLFATLGITVQTPAQTKQGQIITFDAPHAGLGSGQGTVPTSINPGGRSRGTTLTPATCITASCAIKME
jgi:hypothetical protein